MTDAPDIIGNVEPEGGGTFADLAFERLSEAIIGGHLAPGSKLSEPRLSRQMSISRGPLREAIRRLQERGLVTHHPRHGVRVAIPSPELLANLLVLREALEGMAAREAAKNISDEEIAGLHAMLDAHAARLETEDPSSYPQSADSDFHFLIARASRNEILIDLVCGKYAALLRFYRMQHKIVPGRAQRALIEHRRVAEAIADRDPELSEILMRRHIRMAVAAHRSA